MISKRIVLVVITLLGALSGGQLLAASSAVDPWGKPGGSFYEKSSWLAEAPAAPFAQAPIGGTWGGHDSTPPLPTMKGRAHIGGGQRIWPLTESKIHDVEGLKGWLYEAWPKH
jgi:hypothetical protein